MLAVLCIYLGFWYDRRRRKRKPEFIAIRVVGARTQRSRCSEGIIAWIRAL